MKHWTLSALLISSPLLAQGKLDKTLDAAEKQTTKNASAQKEIDKLDESHASDLEKYRTTLKQIDNLKVYNTQMAKMIQNQKDEMKSIDTKIKNIQQTNKEIIPLMIDMVATLEEFVDLDTPFLTKERADRLAELKSLLNRADVSNSEKFRRILEAYQVEVEYGNTIEAYKDSIVIGGNKTTVDLLRFGRVGFYYVTLDGSDAGVWNKSEKNWTALDKAEAFNIMKALKVAKKESVPSLLKLPISKAEAI